MFCLNGFLLSYLHDGFLSRWLEIADHHSYVIRHLPTVIVFAGYPFADEVRIADLPTTLVIVLRSNGVNRSSLHVNAIALCM